MSDVVLPRRALAQPSPALVDIGDCGACVLGGLFGLSVREAYDRLRREVRCFTALDMPLALHRATTEGFCDRLVADRPLWMPSDGGAHATWGLPAWEQDRAWWRYLRLALDAGHYGVVAVRCHGGGAYDARWRVHADHWVLLCGAREGRKPIRSDSPAYEPGATTPCHEVLVSCPVRGEHWIEARTFLHDFGGFNAAFARPAPGAR